MKQHLNRRTLFSRTLKSALSFGSLPLTSIATGLPAPFLLSLTRPVLAQNALTNPQFLILSHIQGAGPININCPGTYPENDNDPLRFITHPDHPQFQTPAEFTLGSQTVKAAQPWAQLPADLRQRFAFWHHATHTVAHNDFGTVRKVNTNLRGQGNQGTIELAEFIAEQTAPALGTLVNEPFSVGGTPISAFGGVIPTLNPLDIKELFAENAGNIERMVSLRDHFVDRAYQSIKADGTPAQMRFLERYAASREQASAIGDSLGTLVADIQTNEPNDQVRVAVALMQVNITPVVTLGVPFGGDNHSDPGLEREVSETLTGIPTLVELWSQLSQAPNNLADKVTFASLNPFGRTHVSRGNGRGHNPDHHTMLAFGSRIRGGSIGALEPNATKNGEPASFKAMSIDSASGAGVANGGGDIAFEDTFTSVAKTLACAVGIPESTVNERVDGGKVIKAALTS